MGRRARAQVVGWELERERGVKWRVVACLTWPRLIVGRRGYILVFYCSCIDEQAAVRTRSSSRCPVPKVYSPRVSNQLERNAGYPLGSLFTLPYHVVVREYNRYLRCIQFKTFRCDDRISHKCEVVRSHPQQYTGPCTGPNCFHTFQSPLCPTTL
jgi:hypothetical protein